MTQNKTETVRFYINRLIVFSKGRIAYDQDFHLGVNIIRGDNSSGKSTIADFIFYALGGDFNSWKPQAQQCDFVTIQITINQSILTLKREVNSKTRQPMSIFWGTIEESNKAEGKGWQIFPFSKSDSKDSFSRILFNAFGLPEVQGDLDSNITMHQILRLLYIDQISNINSLMRDEKFDSPLTRKTVEQLLLGQYDNSVYKAEVELKREIKNQELLHQQIKSLQDLLSVTEQPQDVLSIKGIISKLEIELKSVRDKILSIEAASNEESSKDDFSRNELDIIQDSFLNNNRDIKSNTEEIQNISFECIDSKDFIDTLKSRLASLDESLVTRTFLSSIRLLNCPVCLTPIKSHENDSFCILCKEPLSEEQHKSKILRMKQEINFQIRESETQLENRIKVLSKLEDNRKTLLKENKILREKLDFEIHRVKFRPRNTGLDSLLIESGRLESQLYEAIQKEKNIEFLEDLRIKKGELELKIDQLREFISNQRKSHEKLMKNFEKELYTYTVKLLEADLKREEVFTNVEKLNLDFQKNTFSVNERNNFSASSTVYLKNSIHFGIFFTSLKLQTIRYPRFILCDNIEDKGMEQNRSQHFQEEIVNLSEEFKKINQEFQIIFTTSMISPKLDIPMFCIGPKYTINEKTLAL